MPIASNAFDTVYVDIVGEIVPMSAKGHRWILKLWTAQQGSLLQYR